MSKRGPTWTELDLEQRLSFQCDMVIWRTAPGLGVLAHPGHAALILRRERFVGPWSLVGSQTSHFPGDAEPAMEPARYRYVSFWPYGEKKGLLDEVGGKFRRDHLHDLFQEISPSAEEALGEGRFQPRDGQIVVGVNKTADDIWGQKWQAIVSLQGLNGARAYELGLDLNRIVAWAARFKNSDEFNYVYASKTKNCAGVAVRAMCAGGADAFGPLGGNHSKGTLYMLPNDAQRWAEAVALGIGVCNNMLATLKNRTAFLLNSPVELMSVGEWKTSSKVAWTIRGRMTSTIDAALKQYHEKRWSTDFPGKLVALVTIIKNVHDHLREDTRRDVAYLTIAKQILGVVGELARGGDALWEPADYYGRQKNR
jgi:hypothetical protein